MRSLTSLAAMSCALLLGAAACTGGEPPPDTITKRITVWTEQGDRANIAATEKIIHDFEQATGIGVRLLPVHRSSLHRLLRSASPSPDRPDVVGRLPLATLQVLATRDMVDTDAVGEVMDDLGKDTFQPHALALTSHGDDQIGIPSDVWVQLIVYRKDLFAKAKLPVPDSLNKMLKAARSLDAGKRAGIALPTAADDPSTEQTFEFFALANGCDLLDGDGDVALDSSSCVATFRYYAKLAKTSPRRGTQTGESARDAYLAGKAAVVPWSSAILDDLAGLDSKALPTCPKCRHHPAYLAKNSGVVSAVRGPHGNKPVQYGDIASWTILNGADTEAAKSFVTYMMDDGYRRLLDVAPAVRIPAREGTDHDPRAFLNAWAGLKTGANHRTSLSQVYAPTVLDLLRSSSSNLTRWGLSPRRGTYASAVLDELPVSGAVNAAVEGRVNAASAAQRATEDVDSKERALSPSPGPSTTPSPGG
ncbi:MAG: ABC transporter substrate-binding protein [Streptosporangiales bacterium]